MSRVVEEEKEKWLRRCTQTKVPILQPYESIYPLQLPLPMCVWKACETFNQLKFRGDQGWLKSTATFSSASTQVAERGFTPAYRLSNWNLTAHCIYHLLDALERSARKLLSNTLNFSPPPTVFSLHPSSILVVSIAIVQNLVRGTQKFSGRLKAIELNARSAVWQSVLKHVLPLAPRLWKNGCGY